MLIDITLRACPQVNDEVVQSLAQPNLLRLDLTMCEAVTDNALNILHVCTYLQRIDLQVTIYFFIHLTRSKGCPLITDRGLTLLSQFAKYLEKLDLGRCLGVSDAGVAEIFHNCPLLMKLNLQSIDNITNKTLIEVEKFAKTGSYLKVYFAECVNVSHFNKFSNYLD